MKISSFLSLIDHFSVDQKKELAQCTEIVASLYSTYGDRLLQETVIAEINDIHPDLGLYINLIVSTIGLDHCSELYKELNLANDSIFCAYHSNDVSLLDYVSKIQKGPIFTEWNDEIGIKIQSPGGKSYERTLEKDIQNLVR